MDLNLNPPSPSIGVVESQDSENIPIRSVFQSVELPNLLSMAPYSLHPASSKVEAV